MMTRWTRALLRHRGMVIGLWVLFVVLGSLSSGALDARLSTSLNVPHSSSAQANQILASDFHEDVEGSFTIVVGADGQDASSIQQRVFKSIDAVPTGRILQSKEVSGTWYFEADTDLSLSRAAAQTGPLRHALASEGLTRALVTGPAALQSDLTPVLEGDLHRGELLALVIAMLVLIIVLGLCVAVAVPFVVAGVTITTSLFLTFLLAHFMVMVLYVPNVIALIGLGLAMDYSLLMVHRFRSEMSSQGSTEDAVVATAVHAGRTVVVSGLAVAVGLATMFLVPVPFLRSLGAAGIVVPLVSVAAALSLQPVLLSFVGEGGLRTVGVRGLMGQRDHLGRGWSKVTHLVLRRPITSLAGAIAVVALCTASLWWLQLTPGSLTAIPSSLPSAQATSFISARVGPGVITPDQVILVAPLGQNWRSPSLQKVETRLATIILNEPEVADVAIGLRAPYIDPSGRVAQIFVIGNHQFGAEASQHLVERIRDHDVPTANLPRTFQVFVGGAPAQGVDFLTRVYGTFPWIVALTMVSALVILWLAFQSLVLAVLAVLSDLMSVFAAYGVMVAVFRFGVGASWLGTYRIDQIEGWVPVFIFAMLFGLSMDYEVFIVSRMREAHHNGATSRESIANGLTNTGGVVTAAALIMVGALSGLVLGHVAGLQELGVGLAAGVLIDASLVRGIVLPACLALLGDRAWRVRLDPPRR